LSIESYLLFYILTFMKIGIDIDDVIVDFCLPFAKFHNANYGTNWSKENLNTYRLEDLTGDTWDQMQEKMDLFVKEADFFNKKVDPAIVESIKTLAMVHEIYIITGRPDHYRDGTIKWAQNNLNGLYREIFFVYGEAEKVDKWQFCVNNGIEVIIEDLPEFATKCNEAGITVLLFDHPWNQGVKGQNLKRVKSWPEIVRILSIKRAGVDANDAPTPQI